MRVALKFSGHQPSAPETKLHARTTLSSHRGVPLQPYRRVLSVPRVPSTMALMFLARLPMTMNGVLMTLYIVTGLGRGYGAAGLVGAGITLGMALGAPLLGRCFDRYGLRPIVAVCGIGTTVFW